MRLQRASQVWIYFTLVLCAVVSGLGNMTLEDIMMMDSSGGELFETKTDDGILHARILPNNHYVSAYLNVGVPKRFVYMNKKPGNVLSVVVTPCTSPLFWTVRYWPITNISQRLPHPQLQKSFRTDRSATYYDLASRHGIYSIDIKALYTDSYIHLYAANGPEPVRISSSFIEPSEVLNQKGKRKPKIIVRRLRGHRLHVKWEPSTYNPQRMRYCIVVNTLQDYQSLCAAQGVKYGVVPPDLTHVSFYDNSYKKKLREKLKKSENDFWHDNMDIYNDGVILPASRNVVQPDGRHLKGYEIRERARDITIGCVNKKTNYILHNLKEGKMYYFNVFIKDSATNLTYPYVRTTMKYRVPKEKVPNGIPDSKPIKVIVKDQPTLVKFILKKPCSELSMYVMVCNGGRINYQVIHAYKSIAQSEIVDSFDIFKMAMPGKGRYYIRFRQTESLLSASQNVPMSSSSSSNHSSQPVMVEVLVSKKNKRFPLPKLPYNTGLIEDVSKRSCDSVKIFWQPSPEPRDNEYCIFLKEESRRRNFNFKKPNQCDVERSLNSDPYVTQSLCLQKPFPKSESYLNHTVGGLKPGRTYIVQLIVRRHQGKALSYDLFHVATKTHCADLMEY